MYILCAHRICYLLVNSLRMIVKTLVFTGFLEESVDFDQSQFCPVHRPRSPVHPFHFYRMTMFVSADQILKFCGVYSNLLSANFT